MKNTTYSLLVLTCAFAVIGCNMTAAPSAEDLIFEETASYEAEWIRNGDPIPFEDDLWYPADGVENFLDAEMRPMGEHLGVEFYVDKVDVRPFNRLYTKFDRNRFRFYERREEE